MKELPPEIEMLVNIERLNLSKNKITSIPNTIGSLTNLKVLVLHSNHLTSLPSQIGELVNLQKLLLGFNQLTSLPPEIGRYLKQLQVLVLHGNQLLSLPPDIKLLPQIQLLDLSTNLLTELSNKIGQMASLKTLHLWGNKLTTLPNEICDLKNLKELKVDKNPLETPPLEVAVKGINAIREYFRQLVDEGIDRLYEAKLVIVGEPGAGKTSLAKKILNPNYKLRKDEDLTKGIKVYTWNFLNKENISFQVNIWDFGGQEIYKSTHQFFLTKRSLYIILADAREQKTDFYYWLNVVELLSDNSPLLIILNEKQNRHWDFNERQLRGQFNSIRASLSTNLADNRGLNHIVDEIKHQLKTLPHVGASLPKTWVKVREALENDPSNYKELRDYLDLCQKHGFIKYEDKLQLSGYLHDLGVCLHFQDDPLLKKTVILKPEWATTAVYKVLDNPKILRKQGSFTRNDLANIWDGAEYTDLKDELLQLMMKFKLCYKIPGTRDNYIAPQLLTENQPEYEWEEGNNLFLRYTYEFMPKGILTQFIVAMHKWISNPKLVWKSGVVLEKDGTLIEVVEYYGQRAINIRVAGKNKKEILTIILHELDKIHSSYNRLKYQKRIPCNCDKCRQSKEPEFYPFETLRQFMTEQQNRIQCRRSFKMVLVRSLIDDVIDRKSSFFPENDLMLYFEAPGARTNVFVSYSHNDKKWLRRLQTHLRPLLRNGIIDLWDDGRIKIGADWRFEIENALAASKIAILLISADFMASDFIVNYELPPILELAEKEGCRILPIIVSHCLFEATPELNRFQAVNSPKRPLTAMEVSEQDEVYLKVAMAFLE